MSEVALIVLSEEEVAQLEQLSALGYSTEKLAMYFNKSLSDFEKYAKLPAVIDHPISWAISRGKLRSEALEELNILKSAESGNITASQQLRNLKRDRSWKISKLDIFGGGDEKSFESLQNYLQGGSKSDLKEEEQVYLDALTTICHMSRKYGRRNTIQFFVKKGIKHTRASEMFDEAINLFYIDRKIEKQAYRNRYADDLEEVARHVLQNLTCSKDAEVYSKIIKDIAALRQLDKEDPPALPSEVYQKTIRVFTLDPKAIGLPEVNRNHLAKQIEELDIPGRDQLRIKNEALLEPFNFIERLHELKEESQEG